jgi:hypothetical protein
VAGTSTLKQDVKALRLLISPVLHQLHAAVRKIEGELIAAIVDFDDANISQLTEDTPCSIECVVLGSSIPELLVGLSDKKATLLKEDLPSDVSIYGC